MQLFESTLDNRAAALSAHRALLDRAIQAIHERTFYAAYDENPKAYAEDGMKTGAAAYEALLGKPFSLKQASDTLLQAEEVSPYTGQPLGITYPAYQQPEGYLKAAQAAFTSWKATSPQTRALLLMESLARFKDGFFLQSFATQHTTGQGWMMAFQASGPHAADRALEAIALGYVEQSRFPEYQQWEKPMGKVSVHLKKHFRIVPKGIALTIGCSTFPVWNTLPGLYASLVTGNVVIVKPHPGAILPIALVVRDIQEVLAQYGFDPNIVQLAPDTAEHPITKTLAEDARVKIIDFTGSSQFGDYVEQLPGKITFTEKAGVNSILLDSTQDLKETMNNIAFSLCLYSGQMCTCPQNIFIPEGGIRVAGEQLPYDEVVKALVAAVAGLAGHEKAGPAVLGAIQNPATARRVRQASQLGKVLLESRTIANPEFPDARTASPLILEVPASKLDVLKQEYFGPIVFVVPTKHTEESIRLAAEIAAEKGAISCGVWCTDGPTLHHISDVMSEAATPVSANLAGPIYVNQNAGFSDFHVTGGNPSGNASLTDPAFIVRRYHLVGMRILSN
ncbi:MAG: phenylacetic acid degradation protein PaaN [Bacteroidetes bacterium]|nr:phenylacetic acid degradation protein PaaN [Bacteroidota bacterium]